MRNDLAPDAGRTVLQTRPAGAIARLIMAVDDEASAGAAAQRLRIFIVEDHADTARGLAMYLRANGHQVHVALDMRSARQLATEIDYDILLSDIGLPDGNGWDLLEELRARRPIKAIAMSGYNTEADRERSKAAGFVEHLPKPLTPDELDNAFARAMRDGAA